jgi:hypothetical protein
LLLLDYNNNLLLVITYYFITTIHFKIEHEWKKNSNNSEMEGTSEKRVFAMDRHGKKIFFILLVFQKDFLEKSWLFRK